MKKNAALMETTRVRAATTESGSIISLESAQLKGSAFKRTQRPRKNMLIEKSASRIMIIMKKFLFSIWFI